VKGPAPICVVGAGLAGASAVGALRDGGYDGPLVLIGSEPDPPYERPPLSKEFLRGEAPIDEAWVRPRGWYADRGIDARWGTQAVQLDVGDRAVILAGGDRLVFSQLVVATGSRNRRIDAPGADLPGVFDLRRIGDADRIRDAARGGARALCVGMGFIGAEVAASLRSLGCEVTVVEVFETALFRVLGSEIGRAVEAIHRDHGVTLRFHDTVAAFEGDGRLERVITGSGASIEADLAVVGVGTEPAVELLAGTGLDDAGGVPVGPTLETEIPGVFAIGDVARHDHPAFGPIRVEHYDNAIKMGTHVAAALMGEPAVFDDPHWFWSDQYDSQIQMAGFAPTWDRMIVRGSIADRSFCAFLLDDRGTLRGAVSLDHKRDVRRSLEPIRRQARPDPAALEDPAVDVRSLIAADAG
jgi:3-phenylpropionate/trans-cinnamate dioxygenase ferredoxin reductase component